MYPPHQAKAPWENTFFFIDKNQYILHQIPPLYPSLFSCQQFKSKKVHPCIIQRWLLNK